MVNRIANSEKEKSILLAIKTGATTRKQIMDRTNLLYADVSKYVNKLIQEGKIEKDETGFGLKLVETTSTEEKPKQVKKENTNQEIYREMIKEIDDIDKDKLRAIYLMILDVIEGKSQNSLYDIASFSGVPFTTIAMLSDFIKERKAKKIGKKLNLNPDSR